MRYVQQTVAEIRAGWIGDDIEDIRLMCYCDAGFASGQKSNAVSSGSYVALVGPNTSMLIAAVCN